MKCQLGSQCNNGFDCIIGYGGNERCSSTPLNATHQITIINDEGDEVTHNCCYSCATYWQEDYNNGGRVISIVDLATNHIIDEID